MLYTTLIILGYAFTFNSSTAVSVVLWLLQAITLDPNDLLHNLTFDGSADCRIVFAGPHKASDVRPRYQGGTQEQALCCQASRHAQAEYWGPSSVADVCSRYFGHVQCYVSTEQLVTTLSNATMGCPDWAQRGLNLHAVAAQWRCKWSN